MKIEKNNRAHGGRKGQKQTTTTTTTPCELSPDQVATAMARAYFTRRWTDFSQLALTCPDPDVVLRQLMKGIRTRWRSIPLEALREHAARCRDPDSLAALLVHGATFGHVPLLNSVIGRVDVTTAYGQTPVLTSALYRLIYYPTQNGVPVLSALVTAGVSALDRKAEWSQRQCPLRDVLILSRNRYVKDTPVDSVEATQLVLRSGAVSHKALHGLRADKRLQRIMEEPETAASLNRCYRAVVEAASTPCSLQHLARLATSEAVGCRPGRSTRIESLTLPALMKDVLRFQDVTDDFKLTEDRPEDKSRWHRSQVTGSEQ